MASSATPHSSSSSIPSSPVDNDTTRNISIPIGMDEQVLITPASLFPTTTTTTTTSSSSSSSTITSSKTAGTTVDGANHSMANGNENGDGESVSDILDILRTEIAPLRLWLDIALLYAEHGQWDRFEQILTEATLPHIQEKHMTEQSDQIQLFNSLAAYYVKRAQSESHAERKKNYFAQAENMINAANRINNLDFRNFLGLGNVYLNQKDLARADQQFDTALTSDKDNVPALMGKGIILYNRGKYTEALSTFQHALRTNPLKCPASLRACIGMCLFKMGNDYMKKAETAFKRALQLDSACVPALLGLATIELNSESISDIEKARLVLGYLLQAHQLDNSNPVILNHFSNNFFIKGDLDKVETCATRVIRSSTSEEIRGEAHFHMARMYHQRQQYEDAFGYYYELVNKLNPNHVRGRFGLGQMYLKRREITSAIQQFEHVLRLEPDNFESHKVLGVLLSRNNNLEGALVHLKRARELQKRDVQVLLLISQLEKNDIRAALKAITDAKRIMERRDQLRNVTYEFWNNMGVLYHKNKQNDEAQKCLNKSAELVGVAEYLESIIIITKDNNEEKTAMDTTTDETPIESHEITREQISVLYNMACLFEDINREDDSVKIYRSIVRQHPTYIDCHMRIALLLNKQNDINEAMKWCDLASWINPADPTPHSVMGYLLIKRERWSEAQVKFENIIQQVDSSDLYAMIGLGNIYFSSIRPDLKQSSERIEKFIRYGMSFFEKVLKSDSNNVYAALSLGAIIAERGYLDQAREIFLKVMEANADIPEAYINLGHIYMCLNQFVNAIKIYQNCLKKFYNDKDARVLHYLARSQFEARHFDGCKATLERAKALYPEKLIFQYDIAVVQFENSKNLMHDIPTAKLTVERASLALKEIQNAVETFEYLATLRDQDNYVAEKAKGFAEKATQTLRRIESQYKMAEEVEIETREKAEAQNKALEDAARVRQREEEKERQRKEQAELDMKRRAQENREKFLKMQEAWQPTAAAGGGEESSEKKKKKRKRKRENAGHNNEDEGSDAIDNMDAAVLETEEVAPSDKKKKKKTKERKRLRKKGDGDDEDEEKMDQVEEEQVTHDERSGGDEDDEQQQRIGDGDFDAEDEVVF